MHHPSTTVVLGPAAIAKRIDLPTTTANGAMAARLGDSGGIWVVIEGTRNGRLIRLDDSGNVSDSVPLGGWSPEHLAVAGQDVWVSEGIGDGSHPVDAPNQNLVELVDAESQKVTASLRVSLPGPVAASNGTAWITATDLSLLRIDQKGVLRQGRLEVDSELVPTSMAAVSSGRLLVELVDAVSSEGTIISADPQGLRAEAVVRLEGVVSRLAQTPDTAYLMRKRPPDLGPHLMALAPAGDSFADVGALPVDTSLAVLAVAADNQIGWAMTVDGSLFAFDPSTAAPLTQATALGVEPADVKEVVSTTDGAVVVTSSALIQVVTP